MGDSPILEGLQARKMAFDVQRSKQMLPYEMATASASLSKMKLDLSKQQEEEELRKILTKGGPLSLRAVAQRTREQQQYEDTMRPQMRQFEELQRSAAAQKLQSEMAFRPVFDQLRMGMMRGMGGSSFGSMAGGPQPSYQPMGGFGGSQYNNPSYQKLVNQYNFSRFSTSPAPWMQSYQTPSFPR